VRWKIITREDRGGPSGIVSLQKVYCSKQKAKERTLGTIILGEMTRLKIQKRAAGGGRADWKSHYLVLQGRGSLFGKEKVSEKLCEDAGSKGWGGKNGDGVGSQYGGLGQW